jgi:hypothetical protein
MSISLCDHYLRIAEHLHGKNSVDGSHEHLTEAIEIADCCQQKCRSDLAIELLDQVESFADGRAEPFAGNSARIRAQIEKGCTGEPSISEEPKQLPPFLIRGVNFASAMARWVAAGRPMRTQSEIDERLAICQACPELVDNHCAKCGCACVETNQLMNKLALATEKCPLGKWS